MRWLPTTLAVFGGVVFHGWLLVELDLQDLPGPGGVLLVRDLLLGEHAQGPASWLGMPLVALGLRADLVVRLMMSLSLLAALVGAALAGLALAGRAAAPWAALLTGLWAVTTQQGLLLDPGGLAWGLGWLGLGLSWWACGRDRLAWAGLGAALLSLGVATKPSALPVVALLSVAPWLRAPASRAESAAVTTPWWQRSGALLTGLLAGAALGWLLQSPDQPWLGAQAAQGGDGAGWLLAVAALPGRGLPQGGFPVLAVLALVGAGTLGRRQPAAWVVFGVTLLALALVGEARAERLQPRHLLPASLGLLVLVGALGALRRPRWLAPALLTLGCGLAAWDSLGFVRAFADQRAQFAQTAPTRLPDLSGARYGELPWTVFHESSIAGAVELVALPSGASGAVASLAYQERRDTHLEVASLLAGRTYQRLGAQRCCSRGQVLGDCAQGVLSDLDASGAMLVLPGKLEVVAAEERAFAAALLEAAQLRARRPTRWRVIQGHGVGGELPCRHGK